MKTRKKWQKSREDKKRFEVAKKEGKEDY